MAGLEEVLEALRAYHLGLVMVYLEDYLDHGDSRDWRRRCSGRSDRGGRQEIVRFGGHILGQGFCLSGGSTVGSVEWAIGKPQPKGLCVLVPLK